jgi:hypothetical protein
MKKQRKRTIKVCQHKYNLVEKRNPPPSPYGTSQGIYHMFATELVLYCEKCGIVNVSKY